MGGGPGPHHREADASYEWVSPDESVREPFSSHRSQAVTLASQYDLAISGEGLSHLHDIGAESTFVPMTQVHLLGPDACASPCAHQPEWCLTGKPLKAHWLLACTVLTRFLRIWCW